MGLFTSIKIQTINRCNRVCDFCPMSLLSQAEHRMEGAVFESILKQLQAMDFDGRVTPFLQNEPLLDERLPGLIRRIKVFLPPAFVSLSTNGDRLGDPSLRRSLADSGLDSLRVNCYGSAKLYEERRKLVERWAAESESVFLPPDSGGLHPRDGRLHVRLRWVPEKRPDFWNFAGRVSHVVPAREHQEYGCCSRPFEQLCINARGEAVLCCADWQSQIVLGHVLSQSLSELWESERLVSYREHHTRHDTLGLPLCGSCNRIVHGEATQSPGGPRPAKP